MNPDDKIRELPHDMWPPLLYEMADPPKRLYIHGALPDPATKFLSVVGSRKCSAYAKNVCERLVSGLAGYPICIVSGLALGIDGIAHETALAVHLPTLSVPGSGLDERVLYPRMHLALSRNILRAHGALISEFEPMQKAADWSFPQRNRIMAGMSHAVLIIEAGEKSGTLITARLGMEYGRRVLIVPSPLFSHYGEGSNKLVREGAEMVTCVEDILEALDIEPRTSVEKEIPLNVSDDERTILELLTEPLQKDELIARSGMPAHTVLILISSLEIKEMVVERLGKIERMR